MSLTTLLWNIDEDALKKQESRMDEYLDRYVRECYPMLGWDGVGKPNHFDVARRIVEKFPCYIVDLMSLVRFDLLEQVEILLETEFKDLFSSRRKKFILNCLRKRAALYAELVTR